MKRLTVILLLLANVCTAQTFGDTTMSGTYDAGGKVMTIEGKISGTVTIQNAIIVANPFIQIFDTTVTLGTGIQCERFSAMWYGAKPSLADNSRQLQYALDASTNKNWTLWIPPAIFKTKDSLIVKTGNYGAYQQSTIHIQGTASFWGDGGSQIQYSGNFCALGFQLNKGSTVDGLILTGGWISPSSANSIAYYATDISNYNNQGTGGNGNGLAIDPFGDWNQRSGSTGCHFTNMQVKNFMTDIKISNSISQNGDIMIFDNIQLGDAKYGVLTSQPQEKANRFIGVYSWGSIHTLFTINSGNYYIDYLSVAGSCIRLFNINSASWFPTHISRVYAEQIGTIGVLSTSLPMSVSKSNFDFAYKSVAGTQTLLSSGSTVKFDDCDFRYYGNSDTMTFSSNSAFVNSIFSGSLVGVTNSTFVKYLNGTTTTSGNTQVQYTRVDSVQPQSVKVSIRRSYLE